MVNRGKTWFVIVLMIIGVIVATCLGIYAYHNGGISDTNIVNTQKLAELENEEYEINKASLNDTIETSSINTKISPNAIIIEKKYYKKCDHLIRETIDIPEELVNKSEEEVKEYYSDWNIEGYSPTEIVVYKEFDGICNEHYVVKEHNGVLGIFIENDENIQEWLENTEISVQYLPEEDIENFKVRSKSGWKNKFE